MFNLNMVSIISPMASPLKGPKKVKPNNVKPAAPKSLIAWDIALVVMYDFIFWNPNCMKPSVLEIDKNKVITAVIIRTSGGSLSIGDKVSESRNRPKNMMEFDIISILN